jgi:ketosteroid isomerase-like protein
MSDADTLRALEAKRCAAITSGDVDTLKAMLVDDYVHVHMTGHVDDRAGHLKAVSSRPRRTERGDLLVRVYGDLAVITGELTNHMTGADGKPNATKAYCHQVATRSGDAWRFVSIQLTPLSAPPAR